MMIIVDGLQLEQLQSFSIHTSIKDIADSATFKTALLENLVVNKEIGVYLDTDLPLFQARIDKFSPVQGNGTWQCRSTTAALVNSCPIVSTGEFRGRTTKQIIQALATPFGIEVIGNDGVRFDKYNVELDSTCSQIIGELCAFSGIVACTTTDDKLKLHKYTDDADPVPQFQLEEGTNCIFQLICDSTRQVSEYEVLGQQSFLKGDNNTAIHSKVVGSYPYIRRACTISDASTNAILVANQADWLSRAYEGSIETLKARLSGIHDIEKGIFVKATSTSCRIDGVRLVERVSYILEEGSAPYTELELVSPYKYGGKAVALSEWIE